MEICSSSSRKKQIPPPRQRNGEIGRAFSRTSGWKSAVPVPEKNRFHPRGINIIIIISQNIVTINLRGERERERERLFERETEHLWLRQLTHGIGGRDPPLARE